MSILHSQQNKTQFFSFSPIQKLKGPIFIFRLHVVLKWEMFWLHVSNHLKKTKNRFKGKIIQNWFVLLYKLTLKNYPKITDRMLLQLVRYIYQQEVHIENCFADALIAAWGHRQRPVSRPRLRFCLTKASCWQVTLYFLLFFCLKNLPKLYCTN